MKKLLTIALILCSVIGFAQMRGGSQFDPGAARANLTNITSGSALGVANGGTGKTTAAEALAALGGASLNGSSTVAFEALSIVNSLGSLDWLGSTRLISSGTAGATNVCGGYSNNPAYGGYLQLFGNTFGSSVDGCVRINAGNVATGAIILRTGNNVERMRIKNSGVISIVGTPVYDDNTAAITGGLVPNDVYRTSTGVLMVVFNP